jgi:hypothetical protein
MSKCIDEVNLLTTRIRLQQKEIDDLQARMLLSDQLASEAKLKLKEELHLYEE